jgi:DNA-binding GntR family transcriptional regulator
MAMKKSSSKSRDRNNGLNNAENMTQIAYEAIKMKLFVNEIKPNQKINYRELAKSIKTSPTPVIQALKWLEFQGVVHNEPNRGFYLGPVCLEEIREVYDLRETLELSLLPKVVENLDDEGIKSLHRHIEAHRSAIAGGYRHRRLITAMEFHLCLASLAGGIIAVRFLRQLFDILYLKYKPDLLFSQPLDQNNYIHQEILEHLVKRDVKKAQETLRDDICHVRDHVMNYIQLTSEDKDNLATK